MHATNRCTHSSPSKPSNRLPLPYSACILVFKPIRDRASVAHLRPRRLIFLAVGAPRVSRLRSILLDKMKYHAAFHLLLFCSLLLVCSIDGFVVSRRVWLRVTAGDSILPPRGGSCVVMSTPDPADEAPGSKRRRQGRLPKIIIFGKTMEGLVFLIR